MPTPTKPDPKPDPKPAPAPTPTPQPPGRPPNRPPAAQATTIGMKPDDPNDPQAVKFAPPTSSPPRWDEKTAEAKPPPDWRPEPALDPLAAKAPAGFYADGMSSADEQRARAAWVEAHGLAAYDEATDQRPADEKPTFDPHALAGGGAFVSAGAQKQVAGVTPPTKRE